MKTRPHRAHAHTVAARILGSIALLALLALALPVAANAGAVTDLGANVFPYAINNSDHVLLGKFALVGGEEGEEPEEEFAGPWAIWAGGQTTPLAPLNGPEGGGKRVEANSINEQGDVAGSATIEVTEEGVERSLLRPVWYSPTGEGHTVPVLEEKATDSENKQHYVTGQGTGIDDAGDVVGIGFVQAAPGGKPLGRGFFAAGGGAPVRIGEDSMDPAGISSGVLSGNDSGEMLVASSAVNGEGGLFNTQFQLWSGPSGPVTTLPFVAAHYIANDGSVLGARGGKVFLRLPNGSESEVTGITGEYKSNSLHQVAGTAGGHAAIWQAGVVTDLNSQLPKGSGWVLERAFAINDNGEVAGVGTLNGAPHAFLLKPTVTVSGTVFGVACSEESCKRTGLAGGKVLLQGKSSSGTAVSESATTNPAGEWSLVVPTGKYKAGPTNDGATIDGTGVEPEEREVNAAGADVPNQNFNICLAGGGATATAARVRAGIARTGPHGPSAHAASASGPSECVSLYTVNLKASIPQAVIVDPSGVAHYNTSSDPDVTGNNHSDEWVKAFLHHNATLRKLLSKEPEYPECFDKEQVHKYTEEHVKAEWYTYIKGGDEIGTVSIPLSWDQHAQAVKLAAEPTETVKEMTRVFKVELKHPNGKLEKVPTKDCPSESFPVKMFVKAIAGGDDKTGEVPKDQFTLLATWEFPFDAAGVIVDPENTLSGKVVEGVEHQIEKLYEGYKGLPKFKKFIAEFIVSSIGAAVAIATAEAAVAGVSTWVSRQVALRFAAYADTAASAALQAAKLGKLGGHVLHGLLAAQEWAGFLAGYISGQYPIMSAVIRGKFHTVYDKASYVAGGVTKVDKTTLAVSASSTKFPNIALSINRLAQKPANNPSSVFTGVLPWTGVPYLSPVGTSNIAYARNTPFLISQVTGNKTFSSGKAAVESINKSTNQNQAVTDDIRDHKALTSEEFPTETNLAYAPACSSENGEPVKTSDKDPTNVICWTLSGGRP
jgi:hypothetical protein